MPLPVLRELGLVRLRNFWARHQVHNKLCYSEAIDIAEWHKDQLLIHGLGIGMEQMYRYLSVTRTFGEFQDWILSINGGAIEQHRLDRLKAALDDVPYDTVTDQWLASIDRDPAVFDEREMDSWHEQGLIVLHDAISAAECRAAVDAVCESIGASLADPDTWMKRQNMQGIMVQLYQHPALDQARHSRRVHKAFAQLWGSSDLFATVDRCSFNPPEGPRFSFPGPHLHWDVPLRMPLRFGVQGLLYLTDTSATQGAFTCVRGFHRTLETWLRNEPRDALSRHYTPPAAATQPVPGRAGDLIIWHHALPHGSSPNRSTMPRIVQYIKMIPGGWKVIDGLTLV
jgi:ectoine hydroxylase-related dioxygenase (phytanoyl-CoA dioxygenase family)